MDLMDFAREGKSAELKKLVDEGIDVDARDPEGRTALMLASEMGHVDAARLLLDAGASANAEVDTEGTALMMAAYRVTSTS